MRTPVRWCIAAVSLLWLCSCSCSGVGADMDGSVNDEDSGQPGDGGTMNVDGGTMMQDGGTTFDAGAPDSGMSDAGVKDAGESEDAGPRDAGAATDAGSDAPTCWAWAQPPLAQLRASPKKVFSHYFAPFPLSIDNKPPDDDYYVTGYLSPLGESSKHAYCGGFLRERPDSPQPADAGVDFELRNMRLEVARATQAGLDGFAFDVLDTAESSPLRQRFDKLLQASTEADGGFKILIVLDMTAAAFGGGGGSDATGINGIVSFLASLGDNPALMRAPDGGLVVSAFDADARNAAFWTSVLALSASDAGQHVSFIPMPIGGWGPASRAAFAGVPLYGSASWGGGTVGAAGEDITGADAAHDGGFLWMAPVRPQDSRPKDLIFTESDNSSAFRAQWAATLDAGSDWVQLITWDDYSEDSEVAPSSVSQNAWFDLSAYYTAWFKTGTPPPIVRDAIYYFHRAHNMDAGVAPPSPLQMSPFALVGGSAEADQIELLGFLTAPATVQISVNGHTYEEDAGAGLVSFKAPLEEGTPVFRVIRGGATVVQLTSSTPINNTITYQDPLYHAGHSLTCPIAY